MKKIQYLFATIILGFALTSCGDSFLTQYPEGGTLLQDQFEKLPDNLQGSIMGIYSKMYEYGGDHDEFGQRAIDMYGDIQSGDMAMASSSYGWFEVYERGYFYAYAPSYIWSYYYDMLNLINISAIAVEDNVPAIIDGMSGGELSEATKLWGYYYGQILALRGWAYAGLLRYFCDPMDMLSNPMDEELSIPVYTETEVKSGQMGAPRATVSEVYDRIYEDLSLAIELLDFYGQINSRGSKLEVDADVARIILAYAMLNHGDKSAKIFDKNTKNAYEVAIELASAVIAGGRYPMMKQADLTTTGFSDVSANNWMWGENVTVENTTALASFFGQVDIHTYSYAAAGDTKAIDSKLYAHHDNAVGLGGGAGEVLGLGAGAVLLNVHIVEPVVPNGRRAALTPDEVVDAVGVKGGQCGVEREVVFIVEIGSGGRGVDGMEHHHVAGGDRVGGVAEGHRARRGAFLAQVEADNHLVQRSVDIGSDDSCRTGELDAVAIAGGDVGIGAAHDASPAVGIAARSHAREVLGEGQVDGAAGGAHGDGGRNADIVAAAFGLDVDVIDGIGIQAVEGEGVGSDRHGSAAVDGHQPTCLTATGGPTQLDGVGAHIGGGQVVGSGAAVGVDEHVVYCSRGVTAAAAVVAPQEDQLVGAGGGDAELAGMSGEVARLGKGILAVAVGTDEVDAAGNCQRAVVVGGAIAGHMVD